MKVSTFEAKVVALVSSGHFFSHFYLMLLPPLFPLLREHFDVGFTELGFALTAYSVATALTQVPAGFVVDRFGPRRLLIAGVMLESLAIIGIGLFTTFNAFVALLATAGVANSVYHPADYSILTRVIDPSRLGRVFSIHTFAGYLGEAVAPATILLLMLSFDWRMSMVLCGIAGILVALIMLVNSRLLDDSVLPQPSAKQGGKTGISLLLSLPIIMGLLFFVGIALTSRGITGFGVSALNELYPISLTQAGALLSGFLFAVPIGVLVGGWAADRTQQHDRIAAVCFVAIGLVMFFIAVVPLPVMAVGVLLVVAGLFYGVLAPSRDMFIRSLTPPGQVGKVFGFVSTGYNIGGIMGPPVFGYLLDHFEPTSLFWVVGVAALMTTVTVLFASGVGARQPNAT